MNANPYNNRILELSTSIGNIKSIEDFMAIECGKSQKIQQAKKVSKICGSEIEIAVLSENNIVLDFAINPKACALGQASASILSHNLLGASLNEIEKARDELFKMLKEGGDFPSGRFWELRYLEGVIDYRPRHASVLLAWDAAIDAIK